MRTVARLPLFALILLSGTAYSATVCRVDSSTHAFGHYAPFSGLGRQNTSRISVDCSGTPGSTLTVELSLGEGSSGKYKARTMLNGSSVVEYNIYTDSSRTRIWGNGTEATSTVAFALPLPKNGQASRLVVAHGWIPGGQQRVAPGPHTDVIVVTVEF